MWAQRSLTGDGVKWTWQLGYAGGYAMTRIGQSSTDVGICGRSVRKQAKWSDDLCEEARLKGVQ